jgi:hypothetical protein
MMLGSTFLMTIPNPQAPSRTLTRKSGFIAFLLASPIMILFVFLGKWEMGIGAWGCTALVLLVVRTYWDLRTRPWFWASIAFSAVLQVPFVLFVPWGNRDITGITILPVLALDYGIMYGAIKLAEKMMKKT